MWRTLAFVAVLCVAPLAVAAPPPDTEEIALANARALFAEDYDAVVRVFDARMASALGKEQLRQLIAPLILARGPLVSVTRTSELAHKQGITTFSFEVRWTKPPASTLSLTLARGKIAGMNIVDQSVASALDNYPTRSRLRLPFAGTWTAINAAHGAANGHYTNPNQRFAVDWLVTDAQGSTHKGDGKLLADYYCYGRDAVAVADGTVVTVVDGIPENTELGKMDTYNVLGNHVVLDLGAGEYALYAHLVPGELKARKGEAVKAGQVLGKVGNSGNSSEPHLHFQLMNRPRLTDAQALPVVYREVVLNGKKTREPTIAERDKVEP